MNKVLSLKIFALTAVWMFTACGPMSSQMGMQKNRLNGTQLPDYEVQIEQAFEELARKAEKEIRDAQKRRQEAEKAAAAAEQERLEAEKAEEIAKKEQAEAEVAEKAAEEDAKKTEDARQKAEAEARRAEAEAKKKHAEEERIAAEKKKAEAEAKKKQAEEEKAAAEEAEKKAKEDLVEAERQKKEALEAEKRRKEEEAKKKAEAEKKKQEEEKKKKEQEQQGDKVAPQPVPPTEVRTDMTGFTKLVWEKDRRVGDQAKEWTKMVYAVIEQEESYLLGQNVADDIERFCPKYRSMPENQRLNFWGQLIAAMALPESSWIPTTQMVEKTMGKDPVTKQQVKSEGLLQLSYQDERNYRINCGFDWEKDKLLPAKDPRRTILNPYLNLRCGIKILSHQLKKRRAITLEKNVYWAVLRINGKYSKIAQISATTRAVNGCQ